MGVLPFDALRSFLRLLCRDILAIIERQNLVAVNVHALQRVTDNIVYVLSRDGEVPIDQANEITFAYTDAADVDSAYSSSNFSCLRVGSGLGHYLAIGSVIGLKIASEQCGNALGHCIARNDAHLFVSQIANLARSENDIAVIGQDNDLPGLYSIDRRQQFLGARIHGLPTWNNGAHSQALENLFKARAGNHRDGGKIRCETAGFIVLRVSGMLCFAFRGISKALFLEIFNIDIEQAAKTHTIIEDFTGPWYMGMHFKHLLIASHHRRDTAHLYDRLTYAIKIQVFTMQQEHDLVAKLFLNGHPSFFGMFLK